MPLPKYNREQLAAAREASRRRFIEVAAANTPPMVLAVKPRTALTGYASPDGTLAAPRPFTRKALYIYLHECAHFALGHVGPGKRAGSRVPRHVEEMQAEQWAHERMRAAGVAVPRAMSKRARDYVGRKIGQALARGAKRIDPAAARFARRTG